MVLLASLPSSVTVTNDLDEPLALHHNLVLQPSVATVLTLDGRGDGEKTDLWEALANAKDQAYISSATVFEAIEDPVASGHSDRVHDGLHEPQADPVAE